MQVYLDYYYECPKCLNLLKRASVLDEYIFLPPIRNTIPMKIFSDLKQLPRFPNLTKCKKCETIFWMDDIKEIGTFDSLSGKHLSDYKHADRVKFLGINDLFRSLKLDSVKNNKEKDVRMQIWWAFNDRIRKGKKIFVKKNDEDLWKENCCKLLHLLRILNDGNVNVILTMIELYRNLGEFEMCMRFIGYFYNGFSISEINRYKEMIEKIKIECENKNKLLIQIM